MRGTAFRSGRGWHSWASPDQQRIAAAARAREVGKAIVLLHPGKSSAARQSAATHTGAMAGDYQLMRVKVKRAGVIFAEMLEELRGIAEIALRWPMLADECWRK